MTIHDRRAIHDAAKHSLAARESAMRRLLLIYIGIITALSLGASVTTVILSRRIADTGGLGGMGLRSVLSTAQAVLPLVQALVMLALQIGYTHAAIRICRDQDVSQDILFGGFRRFFPLLWASVIQGFLYAMAALLSMYLATYIFLLLPVSRDFQQMIMPLIQSASVLNNTVMLDEATMAAMSDGLMPVVWIFAGLFLLIFLPMYYKYRLVIYRLVDQKRPRAMVALLESSSMMRRARRALLKLDLTFWWFYALQLLIPLVSYGDVLLPLLGVQLPMPEMVSYFLFLVLGLGAQAAVVYFFMNRVAVTYATFYDVRLAEVEAKIRPVPVKVPWQDQSEM